MGLPVGAPRSMRGTSRTAMSGGHPGRGHFCEEAPEAMFRRFATGTAKLSLRDTRLPHSGRTRVAANVARQERLDAPDSAAVVWRAPPRCRCLAEAWRQHDGHGPCGIGEREHIRRVRRTKRCGSRLPGNPYFFKDIVAALERACSTGERHRRCSTRSWNTSSPLWQLGARFAVEQMTCVRAESTPAGAVDWFTHR